MEPKKAFQRDQRPRGRYQKPQWEVEKEKQAADALEKLKEEERGLEHTEKNFPVLGVSVANPRTWGGRKFTEMASEWKDNDEREKQTSEEKATSEEYNFVLPKFRTVRRFAEPEEELDEPEDKPAEEEWELVQRKVRKVRRDLTEEELEAKYAPRDDDENGDTVWAGTEEHQTCWDERRT